MTQVVFNPMNLAPQPAAKPGGRAAESGFADRLATASGQTGKAPDAKRAARPETNQPAQPEEPAAAIDDDQETGEDQHPLEAEPTAEAASLAGADAVEKPAEQDLLELSAEGLVSETEVIDDAPESGEATDPSLATTGAGEAESEHLTLEQSASDSGEEPVEQQEDSAPAKNAEATVVDVADALAEAVESDDPSPAVATHETPGQAAPEDPDSTSEADKGGSTAARLEANASQSGDEDSQEQGDRPANPNGQQQAVVATAENAPIFEVALADDSSTEVAPENRAAPSEAKVESPAARDARSSSADRSLAARAAASTASEAPGVSQSERVDAARFIGRVGRAFETAHQRGDVVRIRLSPPELGAMQIKLAVSAEGAMTASVETETAAARHVLLDNLPALRERLAGMEIRVEKFDVDIRQEGRGNQDQWNHGDGEAKGDGEGRTPRQDSRPKQPAAPVAARITPSAGPAGADQINLVI